jgi:hypothetical protein
MTSSTHTISPLRQRMIDDMRMRKLSPQTQASYIRVVKRFAGFLERSPDTASVEDLRSYQLYLVDHGISPISLNATLTGLKFLFATTLDHPELLTKMHAVHVPYKHIFANVDCVLIYSIRLPLDSPFRLCREVNSVYFSDFATPLTRTNIAAV